MLEERRTKAHLKNLHYQRAIARHYNRRVRPRPIAKGDLVLGRAEVSDQGHPRKTRPEIGGVVSCYPSHSGRDIHPIDNGRENAPMDMSCVKFQSHSDKANVQKGNFI
ncbi:hypothetical protein B296_00049544 [Ensete ventricosum]|uniref:Uncharacterized protein n=1 Tax=Ensete ventricosum TaxID=4639 RepID=A0A426Y7N2_ENSVE|nr:hypothetical protein B296_00049544 [Ensete ventricosum]